MTTDEYVNGLRQIADWYEQHPDMPLPHWDRLQVFTVHDRDTLARVARALHDCTKTIPADGLFGLIRYFGTLGLEFIINRDQACVARVVSKKVIPALIVPEHEVDVIEWDCEPILEQG